MMGLTHLHCQHFKDSNGTKTIIVLHITSVSEAGDAIASLGVCRIMLIEGKSLANGVQ